MQKSAAIFPGQGAQFPGMGKDFFDQFPICKETFLEADEILGRALSKILFAGSQEELTETQNSQAGIYVMSMAIYRLLRQKYPQWTPRYTAGLSLGEYTALTAAEKIGFGDCLLLVQARGEYMNRACLQKKGGMAVVTGLSAEVVEQMVDELALSQDLWVANYNCPGQIVLSGTEKGLAAGTEKALSLGAKRALALQVQGAFHSGLMLFAQEALCKRIQEVVITSSNIDVVMNVTGQVEKDPKRIRELMVEQVVSSVRWEQGIRAMDVDLFIEIGPGQTLTGMNKRIDAAKKSVSVQKVSDLKELDDAFAGE